VERAKRLSANAATNWVWTRELRPVTLWGVGDRQLPSPGEFGAAFIAFMRAMQEVADAPEPPWVGRLREHLGTEPAELPVTAATFLEADRPNLQLALDAVLPERELIGLPPHLGGGFSSLLGPTHGFAFVGGTGASPRYLDVALGDRPPHAPAPPLMAWDAGAQGVSAGNDHRTRGHEPVSQPRQIPWADRGRPDARDWRGARPRCVMPVGPAFAPMGNGSL
jgi:hypothetical protein